MMKLTMRGFCSSLGLSQGQHLRQNADLELSGVSLACSSFGNLASYLRLGVVQARTAQGQQAFIFEQDSSFGGDLTGNDRVFALYVYELVHNHLFLGAWAARCHDAHAIICPREKLGGRRENLVSSS